MAKFKIKSINYIVSGKTSRFISLSQVKQELESGSSGSSSSAVPYKALASEVGRNVELTEALGENRDAIQIFETSNDISAWKAAEKLHTDDNMTFVAGVTRNMEYSPTTKTNDKTNLQACNNVFSLFDKEDGTVIHPLFDTSDLCYKSYVQKYIDIDENSDLSKQYIDIYAPQLSTPTLACTQLSGSIFMLTDKVSNYIGMHKAIDEVNSVAGSELQDIEYVFQITEDALSTITYKNTPSNGSLSGVFDPKTAFIGLDYNCVIEMPASFSQFNDFKNGNVFGNTIYCKNYYDSLYSTKLSGASLAPVSNRKYIGAFTCGSKVYLKYYDIKNHTLSATSNQIAYTKDTPDSRTKLCQRIESIDKHAMYCNSIRHRTNLFTIDIKNTGLSELNSTKKLDSLRKCIQQDIMNNVRRIAQKVCPANTQLFEVKITS